jgi:hypothetical protein
VKKTDFKALKLGQRVTVFGTQDGQTFDDHVGVITEVDADTVVVTFDTWDNGWSDGSHNWRFYAHEARRFNILPLVETKAVAKKRPHGAQEYKGNGKHVWEDVIIGDTVRLRVPGGWLYYTVGTTTFVPVPQAVGYAV